ncbi:heavy metal translocating P-type ATPase, partial [Candidatus Uhrbacteria bacterium]|nr:heavy metal translocating P-type ATPase [Candidatus Uhrbacteria bacterium]
MRITFPIENLQKSNAEEFERQAQTISGVANVDTWQGRAEMDVTDSAVAQALIHHLKTFGFAVRESQQLLQQVQTPLEHKTGAVEKIGQVYVDGMTCRSCEITIERTFSKLPWVKKVDVNANQGIAKIVCHDGCSMDLHGLKKALAGESKYSVRGLYEKKNSHRTSGDETAERPTFLRLVGFFALALLAWSLFNKLGVLGTQTSTGSTITFVAALILGLVAGTSSCLAVAGGLLLSSAGKFHERYGGASVSQRMRPVVLFVGGRVLAYGILGGLIGLLGTAFTFSPLVTGGLTLLAASYMLVMG